VFGHVTETSELTSYQKALPYQIARPEHSVDGFVRQYLRELTYEQGTTLERASLNDKYLALAHTVRAYLMSRWNRTMTEQYHKKSKMVAYLSAEYLLGKQLINALLASDTDEIAAEALKKLGLDLDQMIATEEEPGLGNGGLGRLAACFIDSLATMNIPAIGYGIRYEFGIFRQTFVDGRQVEEPDNWLANGEPWGIARPQQSQDIGFGGTTEKYTDEHGVERTRWIPAWHVIAVPYNYMVPGFENGRVNNLRLWSARATNEFDLKIFNYGDYAEAVRAQTFAENITKVLYPEDSTPQGKELRLQQQYFFVSASLKDFIYRVMRDDDIHTLPDRIIFQLNDTHPVIAIPEMMRILMDEKGLSWDEAWEITQKCFAYTCHTLLPEALEVWPVELMQRLLPRHMEIIYTINDNFLEMLRAKYPDNEMLVRNMSIIAEHPERAVRMAYLATVAASKVNGVAELHSQLLRDKVLKDFADLWPEKFTNVTNGVTPRRFIREADRRLSELITEALGDEGWITNLDRLKELEKFADDPEFRAAFRAVKHYNKERLARYLKDNFNIDYDPDTMLDAMVKRLHEYKRQMLKVLHIVTLYNRIKSGELDAANVVPRTFAFGAKAAPGYQMAKEIIALINHVADVVNNDPDVNKVMHVIFPPNYNVTMAEMLIPAADLSEQISLAGLEASGTGNMKFALNGALTIGTDDGANVEIRKLVGDDNFFLFGMEEPEVEALKAAGYKPSDYYEKNPELHKALDTIASGTFSGGDRSVFEPIVSNLLQEDRFMVLADYDSYMKAQDKVDEEYRNPDEWSRKAILNIARSGYFSSDRSIQDYLDRIWHVAPLVIPSDEAAEAANHAG